MLNVVSQVLPLLLQGAVVTVEITLYSAALAFAVAVAAGLGRLSRRRAVRWLVAAYVELFRGTSLLVQLFWLYFALPFLGLELPKLAAAVLAIGLNYGAYGSEVVRSALLAVPAGQHEAAVALNLSRWQKLRWVVFPQALIRMLPPFGNLAIELLKSTSLVFFITLTDLTSQAMILRNNYYEWTPQILFLLLLLYFAMALLITFGFRMAERRLSAGRG